MMDSTLNYLLLFTFVNDLNFDFVFKDIENPISKIEGLPILVMNYITTLYGEPSGNTPENEC